VYERFRFFAATLSFTFFLVVLPATKSDVFAVDVNSKGEVSQGIVFIHIFTSTSGWLQNVPHRFLISATALRDKSLRPSSLLETGAHEKLAAKDPIGFALMDLDFYPQLSKVVQIQDSNGHMLVCLKKFQNVFCSNKHRTCIMKIFVAGK
jgi:hypothetical protein